MRTLRVHGGGEYVHPLLVLLILLWSVPAKAQRSPSFVVLRAADAAGATHVVQLGAHPDATHEYDTKLGEMPVPPVPFPEMFDFRILDHPDHPREPRTGTYTEIRPFLSAAQADSFIVRIVTAQDAYPVRIMRPSDLAALCDSLVVLYPSAGQYLRAELSAEGEWYIPDPSIGALLVIRHGVKFPVSSRR